MSLVPLKIRLSEQSKDEAGERETGHGASDGTGAGGLSACRSAGGLGGRARSGGSTSLGG
jgi:hypothetical protein